MKRSNSARLELISNKKMRREEPDKPSMTYCRGFFCAFLIFIVYKIITIKSNY